MSFTVPHEPPSRPFVPPSRLAVLALRAEAIVVLADGPMAWVVFRGGPRTVAFTTVTAVALWWLAGRVRRPGKYFRTVTAVVLAFVLWSCFGPLTGTILTAGPYAGRPWTTWLALSLTVLTELLGFCGLMLLLEGPRPGRLSARGGHDSQPTD